METAVRVKFLIIFVEIDSLVFNEKAFFTLKVIHQFSKITSKVSLSQIEEVENIMQLGRL